RGPLCPAGGVSNVDMDGNNVFQSNGIGDIIPTFATPPSPKAAKTCTMEALSNKVVPYPSGGINSNVSEPLLVPSADALTVTAMVSTVDVSSTMAVPRFASTRLADRVTPVVLNIRIKS